MIDVGGNDRAAARDLVADEIGRQPFADGDELHLGGDLALARVMELRDAAARCAPRTQGSRSFGSPRLTSWPWGPLVS